MELSTIGELAADHRRGTSSDVVRGTRTFTPMLKQQGSGHVVVDVASLAGLVHAAGIRCLRTR